MLHDATTTKQSPRRARCRRPGPRATGAAVAVALALGVGSDARRVAAGQGSAGAGGTIAELVGRLDLERYKAVIRGLAQFGDRRQGTQRNRDAVDWIEAWLDSVGCPTERLHYTYDPRPRSARAPGGTAPPLNAAGPTATGGRIGRNGSGPGGSSIFGYRARTGVARDPLAQPVERLRALNVEEPVPGPRSQVYCTKVGAARPDAMYIVGAHMDGLGFGEAADDDASGTALVMELARILSAPDVETEVSLRFALWNNEETGLNGSRAYVEQRRARQGVEDPPGSGRYPEPRWLGMIQHDMMLFDHGAPGPDGVVSRDQRREADVNIEFQSDSALAAEARDLAFRFKAANDAYATDYPASVGPHMTNTDSTPFMNDTPSISLRENERGMQVGAGWNPHWHQPTDLYRTYTDDDFRLGLNAAQTTLAALAELAGATVVPPR
ncbi:MAG: M20/M25/M40 family metallo-hydrolase [Acidobacteria bacterium]|nr:M20/M25/M40 family metallo-hydrolase [Acidobacteriota bacterium]